MRAMGYDSTGLKKFTRIFLKVLNFGENGELPQEFSKQPRGESFSKKGFQLDGPRQYFWGLILGLIFSEKN